MKLSGAWLLAALLLLAPATALSAEPGRKPAVSGAHLRQLVEQKQAMLGQVLGDSLAAARIDASGNAQAQQFLGGARERYVKAAGMVKEGNVAGANETLNEAIWMIGMARRLVPEEADRAQEERARYSQLLASVESLRRSYRRHLSHLALAEDDDAGWRKVSGLLDAARSHAGAGRLTEANRTLLEAEYGLLEAFATVLGSKSIDYTPHFSDVRDEFQFEFERNRSYGELVPVAIAELKPSADAVRLIVRYVESGRTLRDRAQREAAGNRFNDALKSIREATAELQRALQAAGLVLPRETK